MIAPALVAGGVAMIAVGLVSLGGMVLADALGVNHAGSWFSNGAAILIGGGGIVLVAAAILGAFAEAAV